MFEIYITVLLAIVVWGYPLYLCIVKKHRLDMDTALFAPITYFAFYLVVVNLPVDEELFIQEGFETRLIFCFLVMHIVMVVIFSILKYRMNNIDNG